MKSSVFTLANADAVYLIIYRNEEYTGILALPTPHSNPFRPVLSRHRLVNARSCPRPAIPARPATERIPNASERVPIPSEREYLDAFAPPLGNPHLVSLGDKARVIRF
jgi:hypothetical protein